MAHAPRPTPPSPPNPWLSTYFPQSYGPSRLFSLTQFSLLTFNSTLFTQVFRSFPPCFRLSPFCSIVLLYLLCVSPYPSTPYLPVSLNHFHCSYYTVFFRCFPSLTSLTSSCLFPRPVPSVANAAPLSSRCTSAPPRRHS